MKHLVLFSLACKEIMRLEAGKKGAKQGAGGESL